jgi:hypothetical protein
MLASHLRPDLHSGVRLKSVSTKFSFLFYPVPQMPRAFTILFSLITSLFLFLFLAQQPQVGLGLLISEVSRSHTTTHHSRQDSCGRAISPSQSPLPDNTQHSQQTHIHVPGGIRTHNLIRRAAANLHLRPRGHCDW